MTDRSFILAPEVTRISVAINQVYTLINSMALMHDYESNSGLDADLVRIAQRMTPEEKADNEIVTVGHYMTLMGWREDFASLEEYIRHIENLAPQKLLEHAYQNMICLPEWKRDKHSDYPEISLDELLESFDAYQRLHDYWDEEAKKEGKEPSANENLEREYYYLTHPAELKTLIVSHLRHMWAKYFADDWARKQATLQETVEAFQDVDFDAMTKMEAVRFVTGRDMQNTWLADVVETANSVIFVPSPYIGPYVGIGAVDKKVRLFFHPRLPEGTQRTSSALDRSEILVRLNALADDTRLRILELLTQHDELCAQDIIQMLDLSQSAASRHLRQLSATRYLNERRREGAKCYTLNHEQVEQTLHAVQRFLTI